MEGFLASQISRSLKGGGWVFFSLCGRSPAGAPVSPVLAAPLFASGCAQVQTKQSPGSFLSCDITRAKRPRVAPLGRCPPLRDIETPF